jgi:hypothetical protein
MGKKFVCNVMGVAEERIASCSAGEGKSGLLCCETDWRADGGWKRRSLHVQPISLSRRLDAVNGNADPFMCGER